MTAESFFFTKFRRCSFGSSVFGMRPLFARLRIESDDCNRPSEFNPPLGYTRSHLTRPNLKFRVQSFMQRTASRAALILATRLVIFVNPVLAQMNEDAQGCSEETNPDLLTYYCTRAIDSGQLPTSNLVASFINRGGAYGNKGDYDRAIQDFDAALRLNPKSADALHNRGLTYARKGEYDRAIQDYDQAIRLNPNDAQAFNNRGNVYVTKGQYDRAIQDYDQAIRLNPKDAKALLYRGIAQCEQGEFDAPA